MTDSPAKEQASEKPVSWYAKLGPGLITGAADDDPSGIATYSQAGAQFGFQLLWSILFAYPLMVAIQMVSALIGCVTGNGLAINIKKHYSPWLLHSMVILLLIANTINIAADISAMGGVAELLIGGDAHWYSLFFGVVIVLLAVFLCYRSYVKVLKWLTLSLFAYVGTVFVVHIHWGQVLEHLIFPKMEWTRSAITTVVAILGTTISPYLFFWQASQEAEDQRADPALCPLLDKPENAPYQIKRIKIDTFLGMGFSNLIAFFIVLTAAVTLREQGITEVTSTMQAASALKPVAGNFAVFLFSVGIIGTGLLAVPVLAGSSAYAVAEAFNWKWGLNEKPRAAARFYAILAASTLAGVALSLFKVDPMKALYWSAVINGVISAPIMILIMRMSAKKEIMGQFVVKKYLRVFGWLATLFMVAAVFGMFL